MRVRQREKFILKPRELDTREISSKVCGPNNRLKTKHSQLTSPFFTKKTSDLYNWHIGLPHQCTDAAHCSLQSILSRSRSSRFLELFWTVETSAAGRFIAGAEELADPEGAFAFALAFAYVCITGAELSAPGVS